MCARLSCNIPSANLLNHTNSLINRIIEDFYSDEIMIKLNHEIHVNLED